MRKEMYSPNLLAGRSLLTLAKAVSLRGAEANAKRQWPVQGEHCVRRQLFPEIGLKGGRERKFLDEGEDGGAEEGWLVSCL